MAYYPPPPGLFFRQEQLNPPMVYPNPAETMSPPGRWLAGPAFNVPSPLTGGDQVQLSSPTFNDKQAQSPVRGQPSEAFLKQQQKIREQFEKSKKAAEEKEGLKGKSRPKNDLQPGRHTKNEKNPGQVGQGQAPEKEGGFKGSASTLIGAFKVASALIITGGINAFLFGVPIYTASLVSSVVAGSQALTALKIHRENNEFSRKIIGFTRKLMGRENDMTPSGKEWSMVPVWAGVCGLFGLSEALLNHAYIKGRQRWFDPNYQPQTLQERHTALSKKYGKNAPKLTKLSVLDKIERFQFHTMDQGQKVFGQLKAHAGKLATQGETGQKGLTANVGKLAKLLLRRVETFSAKSAGGKKMYLGYIWSFTMASLGGAGQTVIAALMQTEVDKKHGLK